MSLTNAQLAALKAHVLADPALAPLTSGPGTDYPAIAAALNADASPTTLAWMKSADPNSIDDAPNYADFDGIAAGKRDSWGFFLRQPRDFTRNKIRKWVTDVWGNATASSNAEAILQAATEKASRAEVVLGGTTRTTGTVSALDRAWVGEVTIEQVNAMFQS